MKCEKCGAEFVRKKYASRQKYCAECRKEIRRERGRKRRKKIIPKKLKCARCGVEFETTKDNLKNRKYCAECQPIARKEYRRAHYQKNREKILEQVKEYRKTHRDQMYLAQKKREFRKAGLIKAP